LPRPSTLIATSENFKAGGVSGGVDEEEVAGDAVEAADKGLAEDSVEDMIEGMIPEYLSRSRRRFPWMPDRLQPGSTVPGKEAAYHL
jgi:hypothetical protein